MLKRNILIFGPPGAGKGTQAAFLRDNLKVQHISTGDMFRENIKNGTELGKKAQEFSSQGKLVPDEVTIAMVKDRMGRQDVKSGFLLDGFPRSVPQAEALDTILADSGLDIHIVVNISISDDEIRARISSRAGIEGRADDADPAVIQQRIDTYKNQSAPCLDYYRPRGLVEDVDGIGSIEEIAGRISKVFE